ncbi:MAG TPA: hypothetical protein VIV60_24770, partial [Polyangiaceae bacterium]
MFFESLSPVQRKVRFGNRELPVLVLQPLVAAATASGVSARYSQKRAMPHIAGARARHKDASMLPN